MLFPPLSLFQNEERGGKRRKQQGNWLSYTIASDTTSKPCNLGNHSAVKTTNLFLQCRSIGVELDSEGLKTFYTASAPV